MCVCGTGRNQTLKHHHQGAHYLSLAKVTIEELFNVNFNANLKLFLKLSNCASVGGKNFDNYQDTRYVPEKNDIIWTRGLELS